MKSPCELIVWYILPTIRSELSKELVNNFKMSQKEVSQRLGLTEAAVSQYLKDKRGRGKSLNKNMESAIKTLAKKIAEYDIELTEVISETCKVCSTIKKGKAICELHRQKSDIPETCDICMR